MLFTSRVVHQNFALNPFFADFRFDHDQSLLHIENCPRKQRAFFQLYKFFSCSDKKIGVVFTDLAGNGLALRRRRLTENCRNQKNGGYG